MHRGVHYIDTGCCLFVFIHKKANPFPVGSEASLGPCMVFSSQLLPDLDKQNAAATAKLSAYC